MSIKVSVVIPVYNAEKYLTECIESLLNQTLKQCEFIFVNDGSNDKSNQMINDYKKKDSRIILINQENQGVSIARNNGLKVASGEYVGFVDADDYIESDMYETLFLSAKQDDCDVIISNFESEMEGRKSITNYHFPHERVLDKAYIKHALLPYFLKTDHFNSVVNKLYRNKLIKEKCIQFPEKVALGEDGLFNIRLFSHAIRIKYIHYCGYHYREVAGSATRNVLEKDYFQRALEVYYMEIPEIDHAIGDKLKIKELKSIKLINSVMSLVHLYLTPSNELGIIDRYRYVKNMISHQEVRIALTIYFKEYQSMLGRYEEFILKMIKKRYTLGLYCATAYSRFRNK